MRARVSLCSSAMRTGADRTLELLERAGRQVARRDRDAGRRRRPRQARGEPHRPTGVRRRARDRALAAHEDAQVAGDRAAPARARRRRAHGREDGRGAGLPRGGRAADPRPLPAVRRRRSGSGSPTSRADVELTVAVDSLAPAEGLAAALERRGVEGRRPRRDGRRPAPHRPDERRRRGRARAGSSRSCRRSRSSASAATRATSTATTATIRVDLAAVDELLRETRDAFVAAGLRDRPHLGRLDAVALHDARDVRQRAARRHVRAARPRGRRRRLVDCAITVEVTVISDAVPDQVVIDAGSKTFTSDLYGDGYHGAIVGLARRRAAHAERGARLRRRLVARRAARGSATGCSVVPNHACGCVNMHDGLLAVRDGVVDHVIEVVRARARPLARRTAPSTSRGVTA